MTLYFNRRHVVSFMCFPLSVSGFFGFFLIDLLSDLLTHEHTLKVFDAAYGFVAIISGIKVVMSGCLIFWFLLYSIRTG